MSAFTTTVAYARPILALPESARALRALRPSFRSIHLPDRYVRMGVEGFKRDSTGYCIIPIYHDVPVYVRSRRRIAAGVLSV